MGCGKEITAVLIKEKNKKKKPTEVAINGNILQEHSDALVI